MASPAGITAVFNVLPECGCVLNVFEWRGGVREAWRGGTVCVNGTFMRGTETLRFRNGETALAVPPGTSAPWPCGVPVFTIGDPYTANVRLRGGCAAHRPRGLPISEGVLSAFRDAVSNFGVSKAAFEELRARGETLHGLEFMIRVAPRLAADPCLSMNPITSAALGIGTVGVADGWGGGGPYDVHVPLLRHRGVTGWINDGWGTSESRITADDEAEASRRADAAKAEAAKVEEIEELQGTIGRTCLSKCG